MRKFGGMVRDIYAFLAYGLQQSSRRPHSDKWARISLVMWSVVTAWALLALALYTIYPAAFWWSIPLNLVTLAFDVVMLRWSIEGIFFRRRQRELEARLKELLGLLQAEIRREE
jgi:hypothetical protein